MVSQPIRLILVDWSFVIFWGRLPYFLEVIFHFFLEVIILVYQKIEVVFNFHFFVRSSSIFFLMSSFIFLKASFYFGQNKVAYQRSASYVAWKCFKSSCVGGAVVGSYPLSSQAPTHVEVELGCDNFYQGSNLINVAKLNNRRQPQN
jgi:hypothetical protein